MTWHRGGYFGGGFTPVCLRGEHVPVGEQKNVSPVPPEQRNVSPVPPEQKAARRPWEECVLKAACAAHLDSPVGSDGVQKPKITTIQALATKTCLRTSPDDTGGTARAARLFSVAGPSSPSLKNAASFCIETAKGREEERGTRHKR